MIRRSEMPSFSELGIGSTPLLPLPVNALNGAVWLKLEQENPTGSMKDRTAYFLVQDLWNRGVLARGDCLVESTSGNLGVSLAHLGRMLEFSVCCVVDETIAPQKLRRLVAAGVDIHIVEDRASIDPRTQRIALARSLGEQSGRHWVNQYGNPAGMRAHESTTGPELLDQWLDFDEIVAPVGTGGTICGIGRALKAAGRVFRLVGVEPTGSTIFGGASATYSGYGAGFWGQSALFASFGGIVDLGIRVSEAQAWWEVRQLKDSCGLSLGMTTGLGLGYARQVLAHARDKRILCIAPDSGRDYQ